MGEMLEGKGQVAIFTQKKGHESLELRRKGFQMVLEQHYPQIQVVDYYEIGLDEELAYQHTKELIRQYSGLKGIYVNCATGIAGAAKAVKELNLKGKIILISHDTVESTMEYVQEGIVAGTLYQDPFAQGYDTVVHLYNMIAAHQPPPQARMIIKNEMITPQNIQQFWEKGKGLIETAGREERLAKIIPTRLSEQITITVLGREEVAFWHPVREGVMAAAEALKPYRVKVEWIVPEENLKQGRADAEVYLPHFQQAVQNKVQAIALTLTDKAMVPFINVAVNKGIQVATYNGEPFNFRGMLAEMQQVVEHLSQAYEVLNQATNEASSHSEQITSTIHESMNVIQMEQNQKSLDSIQQLTQVIESVAEDIQQQTIAIAKVNDLTRQITEAIKKMEGNFLRWLKN
jgi:ABC-type sugar transport system substrate-binding protein